MDLKTVHFKPEVTTDHHVTTGVPKHLEYFSKVSKIHHAKEYVSQIMFNSNLYSRLKKEKAFTWVWKHLTVFNQESRFQQKYK